MWCYIKHENIDNFINQYPSLKDIFKDIILLETEDASFLPRHISKQFPSNFLCNYKGKDGDIALDKINIIFDGELRQDQIPIIKTILGQFQRNGFVNGILKARPGLG